MKYKPYSYYKKINVGNKYMPVINCLSKQRSLLQRELKNVEKSI